MPVKFYTPTEADLEAIRTSFAYDPVTGKLTWLIHNGARCPSARRGPGDEAGGLTDRGYRDVTLGGRRYRVHRIGWFLETGTWPVDEIDHRSLDKSDNRFTNLREATHQENMRNRNAHVNNPTGVKGVYWVEDRGYWRARLRLNGKNINIGCYSTMEEARDAYTKAAEAVFGEFARAS